MDSGSVLDFMNLKNYPDMTLDMLNPLGKSFVCLFVCRCRKNTWAALIQCWTHFLIIFPHSVTGKPVKKEPEHEDSHQHFDDTAKLLQEFQDAAVDRVGSRPSSNLSSLSNASERDQHHLGNTYHSALKRKLWNRYSLVSCVYGAPVSLRVTLLLKMSKASRQRIEIKGKFLFGFERR